MFNVSGRLYDAFTNRTFTQDYSLSVFQTQNIAGQEENEIINVVKEPLVSLEFYGSVGFDYYTGFF